MGSRGKAPVGSLGDKVPQKLKHLTPAKDCFEHNLQL